MATINGKASLWYDRQIYIKITYPTQLVRGPIAQQSQQPDLHLHHITIMIWQEIERSAYHKRESYG